MEAATATPETPEGTTDLVKAPVQENPIARMERAWPKEHREALAQFLNIEADDRAFIPFLALCAEMDMNPFTGEVWLIPKKKRGADGEEAGRQLTPAIGRDGLLKYARGQKEYLGFKSGVVCENDEFAIDYGEGKVHHVQSKRADQGENWRGKILGAWCKVDVRGREPLIYYAPLKEHGRYKQRENGGYWEGAWDYTSAMITKAAVSYSHRLALGVSGFVPVDELRPDGSSITEGAGGAAAVEAPDVSELIRQLVPDEELAGELVKEVEEANGHAPFSWGKSKIRMMLEGRGESGARAILEEVREDNAKARAREQEAAEKVEDAVQVCRAEDVQPGMEVRHEADWVKVTDVIPGDDVVALILEGKDAPHEYEPSDELEVRTP